MNAEEIRRAMELIQQYFPHLRNEPFEVKSPCTIQYNCIGWAAGDDRNWWWPGGPYWPTGLRADDSVRDFIAAFVTLGYERCDSPEVETNFEKIALYADEQQGRVTHAARQLPNGSWTSKLGTQWDINHPLEGVCGPRPTYGHVAQILRRPLVSLHDSNIHDHKL